MNLKRKPRSRFILVIEFLLFPSLLRQQPNDPQLDAALRTGAGTVIFGYPKQFCRQLELVLADNS